MSRNVVTNGPDLGPPRWAGDFLSRDHLIPGPFKVDAAQFATADAVTVVSNGGADAGDEALAVDALTGNIPGGTVLYFGAGKYARLTAAAVTGAVALVVDPLPADIDDDDEAVVNGTGRKAIPSGTVVGRTIAERDAGTGFGVPDAADDEVRIIAFDITDAATIDDCELYRPGSQVKENYLANIGALSPEVLAILRDKYLCTIGEG